MPFSWTRKLSPHCLSLSKLYNWLYLERNLTECLLQDAHFVEESDKECTNILMQVHIKYNTLQYFIMQYNTILYLASNARMALFQTAILN